jgi:hypothetical protein
MTRSAATDPLSAFALFRVPGKPFVMTEWNSGQPNDFGAESLLMVASYAAWQDWASVYLFDYHSNGAYDRDRFENFFSIDTHPAKMATAPAAALLYRRSPTRTNEYSIAPLATRNTLLPGDVRPGEDKVILTLPRDLLWDEVASFADGPTATPLVRTWKDAGAMRSLPLEARTYSQLGGGTFARSTRTSAQALGKAPLFLSDTRQVQWNAKTGVFAVDSPRSKVAVGFVGARNTKLSEWSFTVPGAGNNWAALSLSSLDGNAVPASKSLLLTAVGRAENIGMGWNADRSSVGTNWGSGPTHVEGICGLGARRH